MSFNSSCPTCGSPAYIGFSHVECSNLKCMFYKPFIEESQVAGDESRALALVKDVMDTFNFYGVHSYMVTEKTKWVLHDDLTNTSYCEVPTVQELKEKARELLFALLKTTEVPNEIGFYGLRARRTNIYSLSLRYFDFTKGVEVEEVLCT